MDINKKKILFIDLDGTLIRTASGKTFAEDVTDFRIRKDVLDKIRSMKNLLRVEIVTNQGGIPQYLSEEDFMAKLKAVEFFIFCYCKVAVGTHYCISLDDKDPNRKPNTGMLDDTMETLPPNIRKKDLMLMVGDASGKEGDFSDSDRRTAENFGIDYMDVEDFVC